MKLETLAAGDLVHLAAPAVTYVPFRMDAVVILAGTNGTVAGHDALGYRATFPTGLLRGPELTTVIVPRKLLLPGHVKEA